MLSEEEVKRLTLKGEKELLKESDLSLPISVGERLTLQGETELEKKQDLNLPTFVWIPDFLSLAGSILYERENGRSPNDIDVVTRTKVERHYEECPYCGNTIPVGDPSKPIVELDSALRLKLDRILKERFGDNETQWINSDYGPNWRYQPLYDLALVPKQNPSEIREINEPDFASELYKARHRRDKCMECNNRPKYDILWAEGRARCWLCETHTKQFLRQGENEIGLGTIKELKGYDEVPKKWSDNKNPAITSKKLKEVFDKDQHLNAPLLAYKAVYGKVPEDISILDRGMTDSPKREWNGRKVDYNLEDKWLEDLNNIEEIEIRSTEEGKSDERVPHIIFRMSSEENDGKAEEIASMLNQYEEICSLSDIGKEDRPRIVVAGKYRVGDKGWYEWWDSLVSKIQETISRVLISKLNLEEFRSTGVDEDIKNPEKKWQELFADLRYLSTGYRRLEEGKEWGEWKIEDLKKYYAAIVDSLRSVYFPVVPPQKGEESYSTDYWELYRKSVKYMKSSSPKEEEVPEWDKKRKETIVTKSSVPFDFIKKEETEYIVGGIVYEPNVLDTQGDYSVGEEIWEGLKSYMIKHHKVKVQHEGPLTDVPIVESFYAEEDTKKGGKKVPKHSWYLSVYLGNHLDLWEKVRNNEITGFSMAGSGDKIPI